MPDLVLGTVDSGEGRLGSLLRDPDARLVSGTYRLMGRVEGGSVRSGALVRDLGNDQWSVYLLNEQQFERVAKSELAHLGRGPDGLATEAGVHVAAHALGFGAVALVLAPALGITKAVTSSLGLGGDGRASEIAQRLAAEGASPSDVARIKSETRKLTDRPEHGEETGRAERDDRSGARVEVPFEVVRRSEKMPGVSDGSADASPRVFAPVLPAIASPSHERPRSTERGDSLGLER